MALLDEIRALPPEVLAQRNTQLIAESLPPTVTISTREVGDGAISIALGFPAGPVFLYQLEQMASAAIPAEATPELLAIYAMVRQAWRSITKGAFDVGNSSVRAALDTFSGGVLPGFTGDMAASIKRLAEVSIPVDEFEVRKVCWSDDGVWQV